jgi:hypothetical protein
MRRLWAVIAIAACQSKDAPPAPAPPAPAPAPTPPTASFSLPRGSSPDIAPEPTDNLPPPAAGFARIPFYDVDVKVPDAEHAKATGMALTAKGCTVQLRASYDVSGTHVGTLPVTCESTCPNACESLVAVKGGTAADAYPTDPPMLEVGTGGGVTGGDHGGAFVWADGTVQFHGPKCAKWRGRKAKLPARRVAQVVAVLQQGGVMTYKPAGVRDCKDAFASWVVVRANGQTARVGYEDCGQPGDPLPREAVSTANAALGDNPCR